MRILPGQRVGGEKEVCPTVSKMSESFLGGEKKAVGCRFSPGGVT